jgi:5-methyltetrahydropteroyltriglutamate--homocysteine methyltransferase
LSQRTKPPFRADHVGSLLRPAALKQARERRAKGEIDAAALKAIEDREIERVIKKQEEVGLQSITDGEFRRSWWHLDFLWGLDGVEKHVMDGGVAFAAVTTRNEGLKVTGKIGFSGHPMLDHFKFIAAHTRRTPKITIPAPWRCTGGRRSRRSTIGFIQSSTRCSTISARPTKKPCAPSPTPAAAICSSTRCSSPCCAIRNTAGK